VIDQAREHRLDVGERADGHEVGHRVDHGDSRPEVRHDLVHRHEMGFQTVPRRAVCVKLQQPRLHPRIEVDADGEHVAEQLLWGFLE
jgi:hypothetical protein